MDLPKLPISADLSVEHKSLTMMQKTDFQALTVCQSVAFRRQRPLWKTDKIDIIHAWPDGSVTHTPVE